MLDFKTMTFITSDFILPTSLQMTPFVVLFLYKNIGQICMYYVYPYTTRQF